MLYVRDGAPFTPLLAGGEQEASQRAGTENMAGIAALGAVLDALESGDAFATMSTLEAHRTILATALKESFPGLVFNTPLELSLPTTLNISVPHISAKALINLFDAAGLRVSGGSACSAARAEPSYVLQAMGLPAWQTNSAVRLSFGPADDHQFIQAASARLRICGEVYRANPVLATEPGAAELHLGPHGAGQADLELSASAVRQAIRARPKPVLVDVREVYEQLLNPASDLDAERVPPAQLSHGLERWSELPAEVPVIFICRSGKRASEAASALRRRGHVNAWSLAGGLALWAPA
jgi:rhodanese-related sulfurtransferase